MDMLTAAKMAEKWGVSLRTVQNWCNQGKLPGAQRFGTSWMIPAQAERPRDRRSKAARYAAEEVFPPHRLLRKSPFLDMTDLYTEPGTADRCVQRLAEYPEEQALLAAEIAYSRGQIDDVYAQARIFLDSNSAFYAVIAGGMLLALVAMWEGDIHLWNEAHRHILEAPCHNDTDRDIVGLSLAATDSAIRDTDKFPEWFTRGRFSNLPRDAHPAAWVYYAKHLLLSAQDLAMGNVKLEGVSGISLLKIMPYIVEPMIATVAAEKIIMAEIYLRLLVAIAYRQHGDDLRAAEHLDKAILLCLPDRLYGPLVEHRRQLGPFLDDRLALIDPEALRQVKLLHKKLHAGWTKLHNAVLDRHVQAAMTNREREVARLTAYGLTDSQIARQLHISESSVKAAIRTAKNKTGVNSRRELTEFI